MSEVRRPRSATSASSPGVAAIWQRPRRFGLECLFRYRDLELDEGQLDAIEALAGLEVAEGRPDSALRLLSVTEPRTQAAGCADLRTRRKR